MYKEEGGPMKTTITTFGTNSICKGSVKLRQLLGQRIRPSTTLMKHQELVTNSNVVVNRAELS